MTSKKLETVEPQTVAIELSEVKNEIAILNERKEKLEAFLLENLKSQHVKSLRLDNGVTFTVSQRQTLKVTRGQEEKAMEWAKENYMLKIDTSKALAVLRRSLKKLPKFFTLSTTEYLTVREQ